MRIRSNIEALNAWRSYAGAGAATETSIRKLSSGLRVSSAADDAAGLGVAERLRSFFLGLAQATRNAQDGINLLQTAEGALNTITELLQRGRELAVQASNGTWDDQQRGNLQNETSELLSEVDRITDSTAYNGKLLLSSGGASSVSASLAGLRTGWLSQAEQVITTMYGITGGDATLTISLGQGLGQDGSISGDLDVNGMLKDIVLKFDADSLSKARDADRIVARTLTKAVLARNSNYMNLSQWFISGASDLIAGADELLQSEVNKEGVAAVVNAVAGPWVDDSLHRASAYLALKYMNAIAPLNGTSMADIMTWLKNSGDLGAALSFSLGMDESSFMFDFASNGTAYLNNLLTSGALTDPDVGGIRAGTSATVIPDGGTYSLNPTAKFAVKWVNNAADTQHFSLHIGPGQKDFVTFSIPRVDVDALGLIGVDLVKGAQTAIGQFSKAITLVTDARTQLGTVTNALEHTVRSNSAAEIFSQASYSRIMDADVAQEVTRMARAQLLVASSSSVMVNARNMRQNVVWLLSGLSKPASA